MNLQPSDTAGGIDVNLLLQPSLPPMHPVIRQASMNPSQLPVLASFIKEYRAFISDEEKQQIVVQSTVGYHRLIYHQLASSLGLHSYPEDRGSFKIVVVKPANFTEMMPLIEGRLTELSKLLEHGCNVIHSRGRRGGQGTSTGHTSVGGTGSPMGGGSGPSSANSPSPLSMLGAGGILAVMQESQQQAAHAAAYAQFGALQGLLGPVGPSPVGQGGGFHVHPSPSAVPPPMIQALLGQLGQPQGGMQAMGMGPGALSGPAAFGPGPAFGPLNSQFSQGYLQNPMPHSAPVANQPATVGLAAMRSLMQGGAPNLPHEMQNQMLMAAGLSPLPVPQHFAPGLQFQPQSQPQGMDTAAQNIFADYTQNSHPARQ